MKVQLTVFKFFSLSAFLFNTSVFAMEGEDKNEHKNSVPQKKYASSAEWHSPKTILVHTPRTEQFFGVIHPDGALFQGTLDPIKGRKQHKKFLSHLENVEEAKVLQIRDVLLDKTRDKEGNIIEGKELEELKTLASQFLIYDSSNCFGKEIKRSQKEYKKKVLEGLSPETLVDIIFMRPKVILQATEKNTQFSATYQTLPLMNLMFLRDHLITTKEGIVLGRMNSPQRSIETEVIKFTLNKLNIKIIHEMGKDCYLEGGDFFAADEVCFIGDGLRTTDKSIQELLNKKVFGTKQVIVVKDPWKNQDEMHLDTYFNIINPRLVVLSEWRIKGITRDGKELMTTADIYELKEDQYKCIQRNLKFYDYLKDNKYDVIPVSEKDQGKYGVNFLTVAPNKILAVDGVSADYKEILKNYGVDATWMNFSEITPAYGAAHCTTQPIERSPMNTPQSKPAPDGRAGL